MLRTLYRLLKTKIKNNSFNLFSSIAFNVKAVGIKKTLNYFPFLIYGSIEYDVRGTILFKGDLHYGMVNLGKRSIMEQGRMNLIGQIQIEQGGEWIIGNDKGNIDFCPGYSVFVRHNATLRIAPPMYIGYNSRIIVSKFLSIGRNLSSGWNLTIMDSDSHYIKNLSTGIVRDNKAPIIIGENVWLGNNVVIMKNTVLPDDSIVGAHSLVNKPLKGYKALFVGIPAKNIKENMERVWYHEDEMNCHFSKTSEPYSYNLS